MLTCLVARTKDPPVGIFLLNVLSSNSLCCSKGAYSLPHSRYKSHPSATLHYAPNEISYSQYVIPPCLQSHARAQTHGFRRHGGAAIVDRASDWQQGLWAVLPLLGFWIVEIRQGY